MPACPSPPRPTIIPVRSNGECTTNANGDVNGDNTINVLDIVSIVNLVLDDEPIWVDVADVNCDETVNVLDIVSVVGHILGNATLSSEECTKICLPTLDCDAIDKVIVEKTNASVGPCYTDDTKTVYRNGNLVWKQQAHDLDGCPEGDNITLTITRQRGRSH